MLTYFPTPYPDEWWYSVLARFYVHAGYDSYNSCFVDLLDSNYRNFGRLFPSSNIKQVTDRLPKSYLSAREILLKHTLFPYYMRFRKNTEKKTAIERLTNGRSVTFSNIILETPEEVQGCKYCPKCYQEDMDRYGEPYWHREHQIPLMPACPKHGCKLAIYEISHNRLGEIFLPLAVVECEDNIRNASEQELILSRILLSYVELPYEVGPTEGYNNLSLKLHADGFSGRIENSLDSQKLYEAIKEFFPENIVNQYFGCYPTSVIFYRLGQWKFACPERYALIQLFSGITTDELFGEKFYQEDEPKKVEKFLKMAKSKKRYRRKEVEKTVGVSVAALYRMAQEYQVGRFWVDSIDCQEKRIDKIHLKLTDEEYQFILRATKEMGDIPVSIFAREAVLAEAKKILNRKSGKDSLP